MMITLIRIVNNSSLSSARPFSNPTVLQEKIYSPPNNLYFFLCNFPFRSELDVFLPFLKRWMTNNFQGDSIQQLLIYKGRNKTYASL